MLTALSRQGAPWTVPEEISLVNRYTAGRTIDELARDHRRTHSAIVQRLERLGCSIPTPTCKEPVMSHKLFHLITLLQEHYTTVDVAFDRDPATHYTYKVDKALDLKEGDMVVVPTGTTFKVARVVKIDEEPDIDIEAPYRLKWVVQKVDTTKFDEQTRRETEAMERIKVDQRAKARESALKELMADTTIAELRALLNNA